MFLIVLVDWVSFIVLTVLGILLGLGFYQVVVGPINLQLDFSAGYALVYQAIFATLIALLFARRKEQHLEAKLREISAYYYANRQATGAASHPAAYRISAMIERNVQEVTDSYTTAILRVSNTQVQADTSHTSIDCL